MNIRDELRRFACCALMLIAVAVCAMAEKPVAKRLFVFGDSMTGWMGERLQAYGDKNGFEVSTLVWDGATIKKYGGNASKLKTYIAKANPDAIVICLGMNEMGTSKPEAQLGSSFTKLMEAAGNIPVLWVGPCSWPGKPQWGPTLDGWLESKLGTTHFFPSLGLTLPRQSKTNPHPTRAGINKWTDAVVDWIEKGDAAFTLPGYSVPSKEYAKPKIYVYKRMNASL